MENSLEKFKSWILNAARDQKIKIGQMQWPAKYGLKIFDYVVEVTVDGSIYTGHGSALDQDIAICKATAEAFERFCVRHLKLKNSNGCAVHHDMTLARQCALLELIERDCFLYKFIKGESFKTIDKNYFEISYPESVHFQNYILSAQDYCITLSRIVMSGASNILGLGISNNFQEALKQSEIEALRQWTHLSQENKMNFRTYNDILNQDKFDFDSHGDLAMTSEHFNQIAFMFDQDKAVTDTYRIFESDQTAYTYYNIQISPENPFCEIPLRFVKASNPQAQELFAGKTIDHINPLRIPLAPEELNLCYHPFR